MKFLPLIAALCLGACATQPQPKFVKPSTVDVHVAIHETGGRIESAQAKAEQLKVELDAVPDLSGALGQAKQELDALTADLLAAHNSNEQAEAKLQAADHEIAQLTTDANALAAKHEALVKEHAVLKRSHVRLKRIVAGVLTVIACALLFRFKALFLLIPPPWNIVAMVATPPAIFAAVYGLVSLL